MEFIDSKTGQSIRIRVDHHVEGADGDKIVESMFSRVIDLSLPQTNLLPRLHPNKMRVYYWITAQPPVAVHIDNEKAPKNRSLNLVPDVDLTVNRPEPGLTTRKFSEFLPRCVTLLEQGMSGEVIRTIELSGFEPGDEPVIREMHDGTLLLVFAAMPPFVTETDPMKAALFDMAKFGEEIEGAAGVPTIWDDREVFVIQQPNSDTIERIADSLGNYWIRKSSVRKPWWKLW
jgi:hypothetical protein